MIYEQAENTCETVSVLNRQREAMDGLIKEQRKDSVAEGRFTKTRTDQQASSSSLLQESHGH